MIDVSYICEVIFVVMGKFKFPKSSLFCFFDADLHAFELQNLLTPNSHLMNFVCTNPIGSFSSQAQCNLFVRGHHQDQRKRPLNDQQLWQ